MPLPGRRLRSKRRSGWPAKPHFRATIAMTRHGTAGFYRVWRSHPLPTGWPAEREIPASRALSAPPSSPRTRLDREARNRSVMAPGEVAEWSNAPHSKCGIGASLSGVRIPPSPPVFKSYPPLSHREKSLKNGNSNWAGADGNGRCWRAKRSFAFDGFGIRTFPAPELSLAKSRRRWPRLRENIYCIRRCGGFAPRPIYFELVQQLTTITPRWPV